MGKPIGCAGTERTPPDASPAGGAPLLPLSSERSVESFVQTSPVKKPLRSSTRKSSPALFVKWTYELASVLVPSTK